MTSNRRKLGTRIGPLVRFGLAAGVAAIVGLPVVAQSAFAKGKPAIVTLACPSGENASGTIQLLSSILGGTPASGVTSISCTSGTTTKVSIHPTSQPAAAFTYAITETGTVNGGDFGNGTRGLGPTTLSGGVTLTVT